MDFPSKVWDGGKGDVGSNLGYYGCMAVACENGGGDTRCRCTFGSGPWRTPREAFTALLHRYLLAAA